MSQRRYMGIENEVVTFERTALNQDRFRAPQKSFYDLFPTFTRVGEHAKSLTAIRSAEGFAYYVDGNELELCTPPILLRKGFATALADSLFTGRERIIAWNPDYIHTGYSMHWNVTVNNDVDDLKEVIFASAMLFGCTPLSKGIGVRERPSRAEILTDSINNYEQVRSGALLLAAITLANDQHYLPIRTKETPTSIKCGRNTKLPTEVRSRRKKEYTHFDGIMTAQEQVVLLRPVIDTYIRALGTPEEVHVLDEFIEGRRALEIDDPFFKRHSNQCAGGVYYPLQTPNGRTNLLQGGNRGLPLENRLLGRILQESTEVEIMDWDDACVHQGEEVILDALSIEGVYDQLAKRYGERLPKAATNYHTLRPVPIQQTTQIQIGSAPKRSIRPGESAGVRSIL